MVDFERENGLSLHLEFYSTNTEDRERWQLVDHRDELGLWCSSKNEVAFLVAFGRVHDKRDLRSEAR